MLNLQNSKKVSCFLNNKDILVCIICSIDSGLFVVDGAGALELVGFYPNTI